MKSHTTRDLWVRLRTQLLPYLGFTLALYLITGILELVGGMAWMWWHKPLELVLVLYLYFLLLQIVPDTRRGQVIAALPVILLYIVLDSYYLLFGRVFRWSELREVPEALDVLPWYVSVFIIGVILLPVVLLLFNLRRPQPLRLALSLLPLVVVLGTLLWRPERFLQGYLWVTRDVVEWSDEESVHWNGRFSMILYHEAKRRAAVREVSHYRDLPAYEEGFQETLTILDGMPKRRNLHLVVFEGFVDPARMERLKLNRDPVDPALRALLKDGSGGLSVSPVFGGYTAQAEFEVLCGVPALQVLGTIEFNLFTGAPVHCLPDVLRRLGYRTIATNAYKPNFFNAISAYRGTGFEEVYFAREYAPQRETYLTRGDVPGEKYMFDAVLFAQNLDFVRQQLTAAPDRPLLNYVLTIYGHYPYMMNERLRPRVIESLGPSRADGELMTIVNQIHYRSQALAQYLRDLMALDPDGILLLVSDHLPPLEQGKAAYERLGYLGNRKQSDFSTLIAVLERGRPVVTGAMHHHDIPELLYRLLTGGQYCEGDRCRKQSEANLREAYLQVMAHAVADAN